MKIWDLENYTPFSAFAGFERDHRAASFWCVWVKASFVIDDSGVLRLDDDQAELVRAPILSDTGMMREDNEIILPKDQTDILITGQATRPQDLPADDPHPVTVRVGGWQKSLDVHAPRVWSRAEGLRLDPDAAPQTALTFDNAFGGTVLKGDEQLRFEANPSGTGFMAGDGPEDVKAPRLFAQGQRWTGPGNRVDPISFAPVPPFWLARANLAGTYDTEWMQTRSPLLPKDYDPEFRQSAPADQRYRGHLRGGEEVVLQGVDWGETAQTAAPSFRLPELNLHVSTLFKGRAEDMEMVIQTAHLRPNEKRLSLTYLGTLQITRASDDVEISKSTLTLSDSSGFVVPPEVVEKFYEMNESAPA